MIKKYTVIDLFSGAGGLSQGFVQAGYKLLAGIDFDDAALQTYAYNIKGAKALFVLTYIFVLCKFYNFSTTSLII